MFRSKTCASLVLILALGGTPALAQQAEQDQHHPGTTAGVAPVSPQQGAAMGMMAGSGGMPMMGMMGPGMMGGGMGEMGMMSARAGHVEGRIAFLTTELKITDAQLPLWNAVADAIRDNAKTMQATPGGMMGMMSQPASLPDRLAAREKALTTQLDATHKLKAAVAPLYVALGDEQKKIADELTGHSGMMMGMMGGGMMGSSMRPGGTQGSMMGAEQRGGMHGQGMKGRGSREH